jgi:hypothetical protein
MLAWLDGSAGARFYGSVPVQPGVRGIRDVVFVRCTGLRCLPEVIGEPLGTMMLAAWTGHGAAVAGAAPTYEGVTGPAAACPTVSARDSWPLGTPGAL